MRERYRSSVPSLWTTIDRRIELGDGSSFTESDHDGPTGRQLFSTQVTVADGCLTLQSDTGGDSS
jgi:hypothetical protein